ncbi:hypothetical protein QTO34_009223 [Cnephaeus nilssonii]|uniref:Uncharacterized protein n=1 Tax=Cnephaeus nilssonii TaxID=3371016 RepID=A0AA40HI55_CNENI|nr:hypothetical protein QTO34_009223 [Eptesicus nilssonii]
MSHSTSVQSEWESAGLATGMDRDLVGITGIQSKKETMQCLSDCLASCLARLETEIKALKEQLLFMKKNQEEEVNGLQSQIANSQHLRVSRPYEALLEEGEDFDLGYTLDNSNSMQSIQNTATWRIVDSKVVSEVNDIKVLRC